MGFLSSLWFSARTPPSPQGFRIYRINITGTRERHDGVQLSAIAMFDFEGRILTIQSIVNPDGANPHMQQAERLFDYQPLAEPLERGPKAEAVIQARNHTKWFDSRIATAGHSSLIITLSSVARVRWYWFLTAWDVPKRDPSLWHLEGLPSSGAAKGAVHIQRVKTTLFRKRGELCEFDVTSAPERPRLSVRSFARPPNPPTQLQSPALPQPPPIPTVNLGADYGLCSSLAPASLIVGDSVSSQFYRALAALLDAQHFRRGMQDLKDGCKSAGCMAVRGLPSHAQISVACNRTVWLAYIRNDWLDVAPSYPVPDGGLWHCARTANEFSPETRIALRKATHLCGAPNPGVLECNERPCTDAKVAPACASMCELTRQNFSCGTPDEPCMGCNAAWAIPTLCDTVQDRLQFCASTDGSTTPEASTHFHTAHCTPWSSLSMLRPFRVIVLNAGAHRVPLDAYRHKLRQVGTVLRNYMEGNPGATAVFRTTVPGFSGCNETHGAKPLPSRAAAETYLREHPFFDQHEFVPLANRIAAAEVRKAGARVLDVYPTSILRLDDRAGTLTYNGGLDCLHYRGPLLETSLRDWARQLGQELAATAATAAARSSW